VVPVKGVEFAWPGPNFVFNCRGFKEGMVPSVTNGVVVERALYRSRTDSKPPSPLRSVFDGLKAGAGEKEFHITGWVVDPNLAGGGIPPVNITLEVDLSWDGVVYVASVSRPDLVKAKVAPNADHGIDLTLTGDIATRLAAKGKHVVTIRALVERSVVGGSGVEETHLEYVSIGSKCTCDGAACDC
jgi:hypothetical protein